MHYRSGLHLFCLSTDPVMDKEEILYLLQSLGDETDLDITDDEIAVDTVRQQLER